MHLQFYQPTKILTAMPNNPQQPRRPFFDRVNGGRDVAEAVHKYWPADVPHLGWHECAEMSTQYIGTDGVGTAFSNESFNGQCHVQTYMVV